MIHFRITITGTAPLLIHNSRLADPLDPIAKAIKKISRKRTKTDDDYDEIARLEHLGSLYLDPDIGPYIPSDNIWRSLFDAAKKSKLGQKVKCGVLIHTDVNPLSFSGPRDAEGLWADENFRFRASVKIGQNRVMHTRPLFRQWRTEADGILDPTQLDLADLENIADAAGQLEGLGTWRPKFGRYEAAVTRIAGQAAA